MTHIDLLHRARTALLYPGAIDEEALLRDLNDAICKAYPKRNRGTCWCGDPDTDERHHCNEHTDMNVGDG